MYVCMYACKSEGCPLSIYLACMSEACPLSISDIHAYIQRAVDLVHLDQSIHGDIVKV